MVSAMRKNVWIALAVSMFCCAAVANDWYVDDALGSDSYDGTTPQTAKKTIQAAVNCAAKNDTVKVSEGVYADENAYDASTVACVVISNNLTLVATGARDRTHIVGRHADTATGVGEGAVRCIFVKEKAVARIEGFTIRDGATISGNGRLACRLCGIQLRGSPWRCSPIWNGDPLSFRRQQLDELRQDRVAVDPVQLPGG